MDPELVGLSVAQPITRRRYSPARRSCNQDGARLCPLDQPQQVEAAGVRRLVGTTQSRSEQSTRLAMVPEDADWKITTRFYLGRAFGSS